MLSLLFISSVFFSKQARAIPNNLGFEKASGNYIDSQYISSHSIDTSLFTYSSTGDLDDHGISEAFKDRNKYWAAKDPSTNISSSAIFINFKKTISLEAFRYDAAYKSPNATYRIYSGFPLKLNVYTSINNEPYKINTVFSGEAPTEVSYGDFTQFVFSEPIICDKIKLEFEKVTHEIFWANDECAAARQIILFGSTVGKNVTLEKVSGYYANNEFVTENSIPTSSFTYTSPGDFSNYGINNAFDNDKKTYWVAQNENTDTSFSAITVEFNQLTTLDAILYDSAYSTNRDVTPNTRTFFGFPLILNIYTSTSSNDQFLLDTVFSGTPSGADWERTQFVFKNPITCKRLKIEFKKITPDTFFSHKNCAVSGNFIFINGQHKLPINKANSSYAESNYVNSHKIPTNYFNYSSTGDKDGRPLSNAFDGSSKTYWIAENPNTDSFHSKIYINFIKPVSLDAILLDAAYTTSGTSRSFSGFPTLLKIYTSINNQELELKATFSGDAPTTTAFGTRAQYVFKNKIECDRLQIEFVEVTPDFFFTESSLRAVAAQIYLIGNVLPDQLAIHEVRGIYEDSSYLSTNLLNGDFSKSSTGDKNGKPLTNAFDNNPNSYWVSEHENTNDFKSSITVDFTLPQTIDGFLLDSAYRTREPLRHFDGYPIALTVYTAPDSSSQLIPEAIFTGEPVFPWTRTQFIFKSSITCKKIKLEFTDVTPDVSFSNSKKHAVVGGIYFVKESYSLPPIPDDGGEITIESNQCNRKHRCDVNVTESKQVSVDIQGSSFDNYRNQKDGGALSLVNCGANIQSDTFNGCSSVKGGGAIFFQNNLEINNEFNLIGITFTDCHAAFGGSAYIFSKQANVIIDGCNFIRSRLDQTYPTSGAFYGGSALFLTMNNGKYTALRFDNCDDRVVKIYNNFNAKPQSLTLSDKLILMKNCVFNVNNKALSAIYYVRGNNAYSTFKVADCTFIGELAKGGHFIDGKYDSGNAPKLIVSACRFSSASKQALNLDHYKDYLSVDLNDQIFDFNYSNVKEESQIPWKIIVIAAVPAALVVIAIIVAIVVVKKRKNPNVADETEMVTENSDLTERQALNQALI